MQSAVLHLIAYVTYGAAHWGFAAWLLLHIAAATCRSGVVSTRRAAATCRGGSYSKGSYKYLFAVNGIKYPANLWGTSSWACLLAMSLILSKYLIMLMIFCVHSGWCDRCDHDISINSHGIISNRTYQVWNYCVFSIMWEVSRPTLSSEHLLKQWSQIKFCDLTCCSSCLQEIILWNILVHAPFICHILWLSRCTWYWVRHFLFLYRN